MKIRSAKKPGSKVREILDSLNNSNDPLDEAWIWQLGPWDTVAEVTRSFVEQVTRGEAGYIHLESNSLANLESGIQEFHQDVCEDQGRRVVLIIVGLELVHKDRIRREVERMLGWLSGPGTTPLSEDWPGRPLEVAFVRGDEALT